jgi:superfamily I DNA and/or RNA helicase
MQFSSQQFYQGQLLADASVRHHRLCDLVGVAATSATERTFVFYDTAGAGWEEELEPNGLSKRNPQEARLVMQVVNEWLEAGVDPLTIGVIAPYAAQVRLLRDLASRREQREAWRGVEIDTVDGFQGREKEAIVISLVRSNHEQEIGFMADGRRMNVALTRARRGLTVIGDSATLGIEPFYQDFLQYVTEVDAYRTVWEVDQGLSLGWDA